MNHESYFQSDPSREVLQTQRAMIRLGFNLEKCGNDYWGIVKALGSYMRMEYDLEFPDAKDYIRTLEVDGILPHQFRYSIGDERMGDDYRYAVYQHFIPLYRDTHTAAEFELWLPAAIDVVFPQDDPHASGACRPTTWGEVNEHPAPSCKLSNYCRRRLVVADVLQNGAYIAPSWRHPVHEEIAYDAHTLDGSLHDPWQAYGASRTLLNVLAHKGIFDEQGALIAAMRLQAKLYDMFGINVNE